MEQTNNKASELQLIQFPGKIHVIENDSQLAAIVKELKCSTQLGFDTETRPSFKKGEVYQVALLQLATETDAYLFRLHYLKNLQIFKEIFENINTVKIGAAIRDDLKLLQKLFPFTPKNFIELQEVAKIKGLKNLGLKGMTEELFGARLSKRAKTSNWEANELTDQQLMYAATDAWISLELFKKIQS